MLDTTLRDGDQSPFGAFSPEGKLAIARAVAEAGVDVIEAGFPAAGDREASSCALISRATLDLSGLPAPAVFARARKTDVDRAIAVLAGHPRGIVHISVPASDLHIRAKLGASRAEILVMAAESTKRALDAGFAVEVGAEDATRADRSFLADMAAYLIECGASAFNVADTLGVAIPESMGNLVSFVSRAHPSFRDGRAALSVHCHNDSGLALANTLAAIRAGATQVEVTALGIGERAGNAALEELAFVLASHEGNYSARCNIDPEKAKDAARVVAALAGTALSPLKPITGTASGAHASGIHQQGISRDSKTYCARGTDENQARFILTRHSGHAGVAYFLRRHLAQEPAAEAVERVLSSLKARDTTPCLTEILELAGITGLKVLSRVTVTEGADSSETTATFADGDSASGFGDTPTESFLDLVRGVTGIPLAVLSLSVTGHTGLAAPDAAPSPEPTIRLHGEIRYPDGSLAELDAQDSTYARAGLSLLLDAANAYRARLSQSGRS